MKSISKAIIAVMIAAAMCAVPLFIAEDSDAAGSLKESKTGVSFKASSVSEADFKNLVSSAFIEKLAETALGAIVVSEDEWTVSEATITGDVKDVKLAMGMEVKSDSITSVEANKVTCHMKFKATYNAPFYYPEDTATLFTMYEGNEVLFKELGTNEVGDGTVLSIEGDVTMDDYKYIEGKYTKTSENNYVATEFDIKATKSVTFDGTVNVTNLEKKYELKSEQSSGGSQKIVTDYYKAEDIKDVTAASKVILDTKADGNPGQKMVFKYTILGKSGGYDVTTSDGGMPDRFTQTTVETLDMMMTTMYGVPAFITTEVEAEAVYFYDDFIKGDSLFNEYTVNPDKDLKSNDKMKAALDKVGDVGDTFSDANSVANGAYETVNASGSSGGSNIIFYVIIGVLAVAVVALAVLVIKKK